MEHAELTLHNVNITTSYIEDCYGLRRVLLCSHYWAKVQKKYKLQITAEMQFNYKLQITFQDYAITNYKLLQM